MFDDWLCSYWPSYLHSQQFLFDGHNPPQLPALSHSCVHSDNCLLWVDHECLSGGTHLSCPSTPQLSSHPWSLLECLCVSVWVSFICGPSSCPFYATSLSHNRNFFFLAQVVKQVRGRFYLLCQISHCSVGCCQLLCHPLSFFMEVNIHVMYSHPVESHSLNILMPNCIFLLCTV